MLSTTCLRFLALETASVLNDEQITHSSHLSVLSRMGNITGIAVTDTTRCVWLQCV